MDTLDFGRESRYIFARIHQKTLAVTIRLDISLTPEFTIQFYGQPFISAGKYSEIKHITNPLAEKYSDRFHIFGDAEIQYNENNEIYTIDETADGNIDYNIEQPNFNFLQFRSNLVFRWEYKPGSTIYLVWSQGRTETDNRGNFSFSNDFRDLFKVTPHDVFLIKFTHRFDL